MQYMIYIILLSINNYYLHDLLSQRTKFMVMWLMCMLHIYDVETVVRCIVELVLI